MNKLLVFAFVGLAAQFVDGALGMAYGLTSSTLLLLTGLAPGATSASVHLAELGTTLVSGAAHHRFGNVDWRLVRRLALPGAVGAFLGATVLARLPVELGKPLISALLAGFGLFLLVRFTRPAPTEPPTDEPGLLPRPATTALGATAGFLDAAGGGGWGPIGTPTLLASGRIEPRKVIGSVSASEFVVAAAASIGFLLSLGTSGIPFRVVGALLIGGIAAAPLAAWLVRRVPAKPLGAVIGCTVLLTNGLTLHTAFGWSVTLPLIVASVGALGFGGWRQWRYVAARRAEAAA
jgi:uncharacterized membrane protein YfcA